MTVSPQEIVAIARERLPDVEPHVVRTPVRPTTADESGGELLLKCENLQHTGSFKARGALAKLSSMTAQERSKGLITASSGNHGQGFAYGLSVLGGRGIVCVPENASPTKVAAIRRRGAEVRTMGRDSGQTEQLARELAAGEGLTYVSPYNDPEVIAGQATIGLELLDQLDDPPGAVVVSVGGGGLICGVASVVKTHWPDTSVIGAQPVNDAAMAASVKAGTVVEIDAQPTISDGTAGSVEPGAITLPLCMELVDEWSLIEESDIRATLRQMIDTEHQLVEGAAALAIAAGHRYRREHPDTPTLVISCGANIGASVLADALTAERV